MIFLSEFTIVIPQLPCVFRMAKAVLSTFELVNSVTSDSVNPFNFVMWACARKCSPIELVPFSDGWWRTWWQMIHMMPGLPVSSNLQWKLNHHKGACLELYQALGPFQSTFIETHQALKIICKVRSLKSRIKTSLLLEVIITSSNEVFKDSESDMVVEIRKLGNLTRKTSESDDTVKQTAGSKIFSPQLLANNSDRCDIACIFVKLYTRTYWEDWPHKIQFSHNAMQFIAV